MRTMVLFAMAGMAAMAAPAAGAAGFTFEERPGALVLLYEGKPWLSTQTPAYDPAHKEDTYKVYTHVYDFAGSAPITKGPGGKYSHHRGLFIGWKDVGAGGAHYNIWEMANSYQEHVGWLERTAGPDRAVQREKVRWCAAEGKPLIEEVRTLTAMPGPDGVRVIDFASELTTLAGPITLRGDLHHAGMQVRMADEVSTHEATTRYILPEGARELEGDRVEGAWWVCCSSEVGGKRYWVLHMTPPDHPTGQPVYSIRRYARFGASFEPDLAEGMPLAMRFRIMVSERELDAAACGKLYQDYANAGR